MSSQSSVPPPGGRWVNTTPSSSPPYVQNTGQETRRLQNELGGRGATASYAANTRAASDPNGVLTGYATSFNETARILFGTIVDGTALANCYRVHPDHGTCALVAVAASHGSHACLGATEIKIGRAHV